MPSEPMDVNISHQRLSHNAEAKTAGLQQSFMVTLVAILARKIIRTSILSCMSRLWLWLLQGF
jgi:hypothetical protein